MILKVLFGCYIVVGRTLEEVLQKLRVLHVTSSRNGRYRPQTCSRPEAAIGHKHSFNALQNQGQFSIRHRGNR